MYFGQILSTPPQQSTVKDLAMQTIMQYVAPVVSSSNAKRLEGLFAKDEIYYALTHLQNDKTHGLDGLFKQFIIHFWDLLQEWILDIINHAWASQTLPPVLSKGIIKILPKQVFCSTLSHWRPISMMGIIYSIMAKAKASRISPTLRQIVHSS